MKPLLSLFLCSLGCCLAYLAIPSHIKFFFSNPIFLFLFRNLVLQLVNKLIKFIEIIFKIVSVLCFCGSSWFCLYFLLHGRNLFFNKKKKHPIWGILLGEKYNLKKGVGENIFVYTSDLIKNKTFYSNLYKKNMLENAVINALHSFPFLTISGHKIQIKKPHKY